MQFLYAYTSAKNKCIKPCMFNYTYVYEFIPCILTHMDVSGLSPGYLLTLLPPLFEIIQFSHRYTVTLVFIHFRLWLAVRQTDVMTVIQCFYSTGGMPGEYRRQMCMWSPLHSRLSVCNFLLLLSIAWVSNPGPAEFSFNLSQHNYLEDSSNSEELGSGVFDWD